MKMVSVLFTTVFQTIQNDCVQQFNWKVQLVWDVLEIHQRYEEEQHTSAPSQELLFSLQNVSSLVFSLVAERPNSFKQTPPLLFLPLNRIVILSHTNAASDHPNKLLEDNLYTNSILR